MIFQKEPIRKSVEGTEPLQPALGRNVIHGIFDAVSILSSAVATTSEMTTSRISFDADVTIDAKVFVLEYTAPLFLHH
jgi:hypothetical protein